MLKTTASRAVRPRRWLLCVGIAAAMLAPVPLVVSAQTVVAIPAVAPAAPVVTPSILLPRTPRPMPPQRPWVPGDRPAYVATLAAEFEALSDRVLATAHVPALGAAMVKDGKVISMRGIGVLDTGTRKPAGADTVFRVASLSKAFAATTVGLLVERGQLGWDDPVREFVPSFELKDVAGTSRLTLRDVLSHRTGLPANALDRVVEAGVSYPDLVRQIRTVSGNCAVGSCYAYQNVAFSASGDLIYAATGDFYSEWAEKLMFAPLGMRNASFGLEALERSPDWARPHVRRATTFAAVAPKPTYYRLTPAAGVNASAQDMAAWLIAQLGHRPDVLSRSVLDVIQSPQVHSPYERFGSAWRRQRFADAWYGLGWRVVDYAGHRLVWHAGAVQGYRAVIALLPDHDFGLVLMWNAETPVPTGLMPTMLDRYLGLPPVDWLQLDKVERDNRPAPPRPRSHSVVRPRRR